MVTNSNSVTAQNLKPHMGPAYKDSYCGDLTTFAPKVSE